MLDNKLRVVQIGCGERAPSPLAAMLACGAVELLAICDRHEEKRNKVGG